MPAKFLFFDNTCATFEKLFLNFRSFRSSEVSSTFFSAGLPPVFSASCSGEFGFRRFFSVPMYFSSSTTCLYLQSNSWKCDGNVDCPEIKLHVVLTRRISLFSLVTMQLALWSSSLPCLKDPNPEKQPSNWLASKLPLCSQAKKLKYS